MEEHTHHDWQTNEVELPSLDQLFNDIYWRFKDRGMTPLAALVQLNVWVGKLNEELSKAPFDNQKLHDILGTCMCGIIGTCETLHIDPYSALAYAKNPDIYELPKTYNTLHVHTPNPKQMPDWMRTLKHELEVRLVGLFVYYTDEQCWVRLERVDVDYRNTPEGRKMDRVTDYYGKVWFISELIEMELNRQVKAYNECPSNKLVY